jgi:tRNA U34 5-methylaminomethyl-2-thiouridine-forming methyltransferase MnmC
VPPVRPLWPTIAAHLQVMQTDDGSRTLWDAQLNETYHSGCGALAESWHVYVVNSHIARQLEQPASDAAQRPVRVLEVGFGTGMTWLLTAAWAAAHARQLEYVALEHRLLGVEVLRELQLAETIEAAVAQHTLPAQLLGAAALEAQWLAARTTLERTGDMETSDTETGDKTTASRLVTLTFEPRSQLQLVLGDARAYPAGQVAAFDAIYFDAFSPATNPELWTEPVFRRMADILEPGGRLVSYCVSGAVRAQLAAAGFEVTRLPGPPGGKREVLAAIKRHS